LERSRVAESLFFATARNGEGPVRFP
jgi:hypothetical protein